MAFNNHGRMRFNTIFRLHLDTDPVNTSFSLCATDLNQSPWLRANPRLLKKAILLIIYL
jgi:hypothetical protein